MTVETLGRPAPGSLSCGRISTMRPQTWPKAWLGTTTRTSSAARRQAARSPVGSTLRAGRRPAGSDDSRGRATGPGHLTGSSPTTKPPTLRAS